MKRTIEEQIAANKRASMFYVLLMVLLLSLLGAAIVGYYEPHAWFIGAAGAALVGLVVAMIAVSAGKGIVLSISNTRQASPLEMQVLNNVAEEMAIAAGIPKPEVYMIDDSAPNAFATGMSPDKAAVVFTTGLVEKLSREELQGVMGHEMSHIRNYDTRMMTTLAIVAGLIPLLADAMGRSLWWGGGRRSGDRENSGVAIWAIIGLILAILAPLFARLLELAVSRQREFLADTGSAELTRNPDGLASALAKIEADPEPLEAANRATQHMYIINPLRLKDDGSSMFSTHPSTADRIRRLRGLAGSAGPLP